MRFRFASEIVIECADWKACTLYYTMRSEGEGNTLKSMGGRERLHRWRETLKERLGASQADEAHEHQDFPESIITYYPVLFGHLRPVIRDKMR